MGNDLLVWGLWAQDVFGPSKGPGRLSVCHACRDGLVYRVNLQRDSSTAWVAWLLMVRTPVVMVLACGASTVNPVNQPVHCKIILSVSF